MNSDGCSLGSPSYSGGGRILRDASSNMLLAFAIPFGYTMSMQAQAKPLLFGVKLCLRKCYSLIHIEMDSLALVCILTKKWPCPWNIFYEICELLQRIPSFIRVSCCLREANMVADVLSRRVLRFLCLSFISLKFSFHG